MLLYIPNVIANTTENSTGPVEISGASTVTVFLKNQGLFPVIWWLEISPNGEDFLRENAQTSTNPGCLQRLILSTPAPFLRVKYKTEFCQTSFDLWIYYF
ncbi:MULTISPECIES: DUF6385 domain-containing protein [unclassified Carboxydocella]|uniref:DUF6385 domain-containing protein n=1 Tax=unclassified Carboxydocella TaxID=2685367 RepID=UPI0009AEB6D5|nr:MULTISPECIES: DUF6385 domain-containing protein [unclassified Carboxydocella]GAW29563.1 hypothetical protein ULO1_21330 [Carboxydocella sp. ULO1]